MLAGPDATAPTLPAGGGACFNAFGISVTQSTMGTACFGQTWESTRGGVKRAAGTVSGTMSKGTTSDKFAIANLSQTSAQLVLTFFTGCTLTFNAVFTAITGSTALESYNQISYSFIADGAVTEAWVTA